MLIEIIPNLDFNFNLCGLDLRKGCKDDFLRGSWLSWWKRLQFYPRLFYLDWKSALGKGWLLYVLDLSHQKKIQASIHSCELTWLQGNWVNCEPLKKKIIKSWKRDEWSSRGKCILVSNDDWLRPGFNFTAAYPILKRRNDELSPLFEWL